MFFIFILCTCYVIQFTNAMYAKELKTVALIAGGQGSTTSRTIGDYYESGLTLAFCHALSDAIKQKDSTITVTVVKASAFSKAATFALAEGINKKNPDLVIHIGLYAQPEEVPCMHFFYYGHAHDPVIKNNINSTPVWINLREAHIIHQKKSFSAVNHAAKALQPYANQGAYIVFPPKKVPFAPLKGFLPPAFACEIGIENSNDWKRLVNDIANTCIAAFTDR